MSISESDRLALRQELERVFSNAKHAETLMRSLPMTESTQVATKSDIEHLAADLRREMEVMGRELRADFKAEMATVHTGMAELHKQMALQFRLTLLLQIGVLVAVAGIVAGLS